MTKKEIIYLQEINNLLYKASITISPNPANGNASSRNALKQVGELHKAIDILTCISLYKKETMHNYKEIDEIIEDVKEWDKQIKLEEILRSKEKNEELEEFKKTLKK